MMHRFLFVAVVLAIFLFFFALPIKLGTVY